MTARHEALTLCNLHHNNGGAVKTRRRAGRAALILAASLMFTGFSAPTAFATSYSSIYGTYGPILGYNYKNQATASNSPYQGIGSAFNNDNPVRSEPAGYFGAQGILYRNGAICRSTQLSYSQFVTTAWNAYTPSGSCGSGVYNAKGSTAAYNGNGYSTYYTPVSPNFNG